MPYRLFESNSIKHLEDALNKLEKEVKSIDNVWIVPYVSWEGKQIWIVVKYQPKAGGI